MREVPTHVNMKSYSQIISQFLSDPCDVKNNKSLRQLEEYLELSISYTVIPDSPSKVQWLSGKLIPVEPVNQEEIKFEIQNELPKVVETSLKTVADQSQTLLVSMPTPMEVPTKISGTPNTVKLGFAQAMGRIGDNDG